MFMPKCSLVSKAKGPVEEDKERLLSETEADAASKAGTRLIRAHISLPAVAILLCSWVVVAILTIHLSVGSCMHGANVMDTPVRSHMVYEAQVLPYKERSDRQMYFGAPGPEHDRLWDELVEGSIFGLDYDTMIKLGRAEEGVRFPDATYYATFSVFHNLHCLRRLHRISYLEVYYPQLNDEDKEALRSHTAHCLHMLKEAIMCQADTSVITMRWKPDEALPGANFTSPHECLDWQKLRDWLAPRSVNLDTIRDLQHPTLGPAYANLSQFRIGAM